AERGVKGPVREAWHKGALLASDVAVVAAAVAMLTARCSFAVCCKLCASLFRQCVIQLAFNPDVRDSGRLRATQTVAQPSRPTPGARVYLNQLASDGAKQIARHRTANSRQLFLLATCSPPSRYVLCFYRI